MQEHVEEHPAPADIFAVEHCVGMRQALAIAIPNLRVLPLLAARFHPFQRAAQDEAGRLSVQAELVRSAEMSFRGGMNRSQ